MANQWTGAGPLLPRLLRNIQYDIRSGCWWWLGARSKGYGDVRVAQRGHVQAHRLTYELLVGPVPEGLELDHLCRHRSCINPAHLEPVPHVVNVHRGTSPSAINARRTTCIRGHSPLTVKRDGKRYCRTCSAERQRRLYVSAKDRKGQNHG